MSTINFSNNGRILRGKLSKSLAVLLIIAFMTAQIEYSYAADVQPAPATASAQSGAAGTTTTAPAPTAAPKKEASAYMASSSAGGGDPQKQFSASSMSGPLGATKEIFQTDLFTGRASSVIPIVVPPGRGGIQPDIKLAYTSGGGNGWCGVGWDLSFGSISRNTDKGAPTYDDTKDKFTAVMSGVASDLISIGGAEYRAKFDPSYLRFRFTENSWEVWDKSGTKYQFGTTAASRTENALGTCEWYLDRVTNVHGDYMSFTYIHDAGKLYPDTIVYTGNDSSGDQPRRSVKFILDAAPRPDTSESYRSGVKVETRLRLSEIVVNDNSALVRRYALTYTQSQNTGRSLLASVTQYGSDGTSTLPSIAFTYQTGIGGWVQDDAWTVPDGSFVDGTNDQGRVLADVNGDALPDFMVAIAWQNGAWYERSYKNIGNGWISDGGWNAPNGNFIWVTQGIYIDDGRRLADMNADGFPEWLVANKYWYGGGDCTYGTCLNGKTYWQTAMTSQWRIPDGFFAERGADQGRRLADINGDGLTDLSISKGGYRATYLNDGTGWTQDNSWNVPDGDYTNGAQLVDINGDGFTDLLIAYDGTKASYINNGKGWTRDDTWNIPDGDFVTGGKSDGRVLTDVNGDGLPDIVIGKDGYKKTYLNTGRGWVLDERWNIPDGDIVTGGQDKGRRFADVDGDSMTDLVIADGSYRKTYINKSPAPDLLSSVSNGVGGTTAITYTPSTRYYNNGADSISDLPIIFQTVNSVTKSDGLGNSYTVTYNYWNGNFDVKNREYLGFNQVRETDVDGNYADSWFKQDPVYKGRLYLQEKRDRAGNLYSRTWNNWANFEPYIGVYLPYLKSQDQYLYDGDDTYKCTQAAYEYDSFGNPIKISYSGDDTAGWGTILRDEKYISIDYAYNVQKWILDKPCHTYTADWSGNKVSEAWYYYDGSQSWFGATPPYGKLTKEEKWLNTGPNISATMTYDAYGNPISATDAKGRTTTKTYDSTLHTFPETMTNYLGHIQRFTYDVKTGEVLTATDPNGQISSRLYDVFGRLIQSFGPLDDVAHPSVWYEYDLAAFPLKVTARTREMPNTDDPAKIHATYTFYDGLGRAIETKSDAEISSQQIVSGIVTFNNRGLVESKYVPYYITAATPEDAAKFSTPDFTKPSASFQYDPMGRVIKVINPDSTYSTITYDDWVTTSQDENGHRKRSTKDAYGRTIKIEEFSGADIYTTVYQYDTLDNLVKTIDTLANTATIQYDSLGRKTSMNDPDMGIWSYQYDDVGNLIKQTDAKGQSLLFEYDALNRITKKDYPSGTDVIYTYDTYPAGVTAGQYSKGRLTSVSDASGKTVFYYDKLGREIMTAKTVDSMAYTTSRTYDALDRITSIKYPDGETVSYSYNRQGGVETVVGRQTYVAGVDYNASGQMTVLRYGNNITTSYQYDPKTLRLTHLDTQNAQLAKIQDLTYAFDNVGNVRSIIDRSPGGTNTQSFQYDDLDRLAQATGAGYGTISYQYDPIGNMTKKGDLELIYPGSGLARPHAVKEVKRNGQTVYAPSYDANGNMIQKGSKVFSYDCENRLAQVSDVASGGVITVNISLKAGMNFFSLPVMPDNTNITSVLSSLTFGTDYTQVSRYNAITRKFEHWVNNAKFNQFSSLEYGTGYQIYVSNPAGCTLRVTGRAPYQGTIIALASGYNLIGAPTTTSIPVSEALANLKFGIDYDKVAKYDPATKTFQYYYGSAIAGQFSTMDAGYAYYIHTLKVALWQIPIKTAGATTFTYDGDGGRVKKVTPDGSTNIYIGSIYEVATTPSAGQKTTKSIFLGANRICQVEASNVYYYHQDHLGSSNVITDKTGAQVALYEYSPYGETSKSSGSFSTEIRYTGQRLDSSTSLYYYGARYYDPELGRFIQPDTIVSSPFNPQDLNRYSYCRNNPINYIDPTGHFIWFIAAVIVGMIMGGVAAAMSGQSVGMGILMGGLGGALVACGGMGTAALWGPAWSFVGAAAGGAVSGAANAAVFGGNIGIGALTGALGAGVGSGVGYGAGQAFGSFWGAMAGGASGGAIAGGVGAEMSGGSFSEGAGMGAAYGTVGGLVGYGAGKASSNRGLQRTASQLGIDLKRSVAPDIVNKRTTPNYKEGPYINQKIYRVFGDDAKWDGRSWTPENPDSVPNYRIQAGLPNANSGRFVAEATITQVNNIIVRESIVIYGNGDTRMIQEYVMPQDTQSQIALERVSGANPEY